MSEFMDLLRSPALGVVFMLILMAGVIFISAFAAMIAQFSLLLRIRPWNTSGKAAGKEKTGIKETDQTTKDQVSFSEFSDSPQVVDFESADNEVIDAVWWPVL